MNTPAPTRTKLPVVLMASMYALSASVAMLCWVLGALPGYWAGVTCTLYVASFLGFITLSWLRPNESMTSRTILIWHMLICTVPGHVARYHIMDSGVRNTYLLVYVVIIMFGLLSLTRRQYLLVLALYIGTHLALLGALRQWQPAAQVGQADLVFTFALALALGSIVVLRGQIMHISTQLRARSLALQETMDRIQAQIARDELTGAMSRRGMGELLMLESARAARSGQALCLALIDIDHFKQINDRFGHAVGDYMLKLLVQRISEQLRATDLLARWGGEEFLLLMPSTTLDGGRQKVQRLLEAVEQMDVSEMAPQWRLTFSAGVAQCLTHEANSRTVSRADGALYQAKANGRKQVCVAP